MAGGGYVVSRRHNLIINLQRAALAVLTNAPFYSQISVRARTAKSALIACL